MARTIILFRGVQAPRAELTDFWSNKRRGKRPRKAEITSPKEHDAVSCWDTREKVEEWARAFPEAVGSYVAELHVPENGPLELIEEGDPGHWNVYGEPEVFLSVVKAVHPVRSA